MAVVNAHACMDAYLMPSVVSVHVLECVRVKCMQGRQLTQAVMEAESSSPEFFDAQDWDDMLKRSEKDLKVEEEKVKMMGESIG